MATHTVTLNNGAEMPRLGMGTYNVHDPGVIVEAAEVGYRHFDTAAKYENEETVGQGVRDCGIPREEVFVTTKLDGRSQGDDKALADMDASLARLGLDYVDLLLIHWPLPSRGQFVSTWQTFEKLLEQGKTKAIGVSNFKPTHLQTLLEQTSVIPAVDQIELNPYIQRRDYRNYNAEHDIVSVGYTPLGRKSNLLDEPVLNEVGEAHGKTPAQVVLRWHLQSGIVPIPKSQHRERLVENFDVFDFELSGDDMDRINTLSLGEGAGVDSDVEGH